MDRQSKAFRGASPDDLEPGDWTDLVDRGLVVPVDTSQPIKPPEQYEADNWDAGREPAKTIGDAIRVAQERGDDPSPYQDL